MAHGLVVGQAFGAGTVVGAEPSVGLAGGAVAMPRADIGAQKAGLPRLHVTIDAIKRGQHAMLGQQIMVGEHDFDGFFSRRAEIQGVKRFGIEMRDAGCEGELGHNFGKISDQSARPAKRIDATAKRRGDQLLKTADDADV